MVTTQPFDRHSLHAAYGGGLDPAAVVNETFRRIEAAGDPGIFLHLIDRDAALAAVADLGPFDPAAKPLWGLPFAIKDNIDAAGAPTTAACPAFAYRAESDAAAVAVLRRAGAILIGKTNLDQFATGLVGLRTPYPAPKNALDPLLVPGGSSSGSAVAVARGLVSFALGTDTAGSGRVPAALNGIVGLKPTLGAVSTTGVVPACRSLDAVSVFALTVEDAYAVFRAAARFDPADPYARDAAPPPLAPAPPAFRVGVPDANSRVFFGDARQAEAFDKALDGLSVLGATVAEIDFTPFFDVARMLYDGPWIAERHTVVEALLRDTPDALHPATRAVFDPVAGVTATDVFRAQHRLAALKRRIAPLFDAVDLLCVPSVPTFFTVGDVEADPMGPNARLGTYTNFVNLLDLCGIAVPTAARADGRPGSVTLLAPAGADGRVAAIADAVQRLDRAPLGATDWSLPPARPNRDAARATEIPLAVVGAHMSGLPLNGELTGRGARFLYAAETEAAYRLYKLDSGPPQRPGLVRDAGGDRIALEVWGLPADRFGDFIDGIPAPLGIGTVTLADGRAVKGFLCETAGLAGAEDITRHGGWRAYLNASVPSHPRAKETHHA